VRKAGPLISHRPPPSSHGRSLLPFPHSNQDITSFNPSFCSPMISPKERAAQRAFSINRSRTSHGAFAVAFGFKRTSKVSHLVTTSWRSSFLYVSIPVPATLHCQFRHMETTDSIRGGSSKSSERCSLERE
jgi:hypothetical protein